MIWKPKEKDLTLEEAVVIAKKELSPFWFGKSPQIAGVLNGGKFSLFPLNPEFTKESWLVIVVDPTEYSGESGILFAKEWHRRYAHLHLQILVVFTATYGFLREQEIAQKFAEKFEADFVTTVDVDQTLAPALGAAVPPRVVLLQNNQKHFEADASNWVEVTEGEIQKFMRKTDPGLPLLPMYRSKMKMIEDTGRLEFGSAPKFGKPNTDQAQITGKWVQEADRITTSDPTATISFVAPSSKVALVAQSISKTAEHPNITVEFRGAPVYEAIAGEDIRMEEDGHSVIAVRKPQLYHMLTALPAKDRQLTLRFHGCDNAPVAIYGVRFGE